MSEHTGRPTVLFELSKRLLLRCTDGLGLCDSYRRIMAKHKGLVVLLFLGLFLGSMLCGPKRNSASF